MSKLDILQANETTLLEGLIEQQGVFPVNELNDLSRLWPADDDPDELLEYLLNERRERRLPTRPKNPRDEHNTP
ncbi:MAG TPA: hypothetical protein VJX67_26050 [Blastocatellia bacterium]|nr:hypothetical protein [Blastocatellia bacterium]